MKIRDWFRRDSRLDELKDQLSKGLIRLEVVIRTESQRIRNVINQRSTDMEQATQDVMDVAKSIGEAVVKLPGMVDAFEARITDVIKNSTGMSQEDKDALAGAVTDLKSDLATVTGALADAADGTDEAAADTPSP